MVWVKRPNPRLSHIFPAGRQNADEGGPELKWDGEMMLWLSGHRIYFQRAQNSIYATAALESDVEKGNDVSMVSGNPAIRPSSQRNMLWERIYGRSPASCFLAPKTSCVSASDIDSIVHISPCHSPQWCLMTAFPLAATDQSRVDGLRLDWLTANPADHLFAHRIPCINILCLQLCVARQGRDGGERCTRSLASREGRGLDKLMQRCSTRERFLYLAFRSTSFVGNAKGGCWWLWRVRSQWPLCMDELPG